MSFSLPALLQEIMEITRASQAGESSAYLVGGAVRDLLQLKEPHDFDFVMAGNVRPVAKKVANRLGGFFYMLDEERNTARVLFDPPGKPRMVIDYASMRGVGLEDDLRSRDFSINAMALDVSDPYRLVDPLGGARDLKDRVLRLCSPGVFGQDPVRLLRAIRMAVEMEMRMAPDTIAALRQASTSLGSVTPERRRDELFRMLDGSRPQVSLRLMESFGLLPFVLPELVQLKGLNQPEPHVLDAWEHTLAALGEMNSLLSFIKGDYYEDAGNLTIGTAVTRLGRFRKELDDHFQQWVTPNRSRRSLLNLAILFHDAGKPASFSTDVENCIHFYGHEQIGAQLAVNRGRELALSLDETDYLEDVIRNHMRIHWLADSAGEEISRRTIYRYFKASGQAGIDVALVSLADTLATWRTSLRQDTWLRELDICRTLFEAWWEKKEAIVQPVGLINGNDIQEHFNLKAGPQIGEMLELVRENQASGELETREDALQFLERWLEQQSWRSENGNLN